MTAILVGRPLILGEDPGLSSSLSDPGTFVVSLLTLCTAAAWAGWRLWSKETAWYGGLVEVGLLLIVVASFIGITVASNKHVAWLISWEWLILLVGFSTLRQLAITRAELQGFLTALLATVVSLAFYAAYQASVELPATKMGLDSADAGLKERALAGEIIPGLDSPERAVLRERIEDGHVFATYAHPNNFAGYLVLFIPALFAVAWLARHVRRPKGQRMFLLGFAVVALIALYLTHSRGAMLGLLVASVLVAGLVGRRWLAANPVYILVGLVAVVALPYLVYQFGVLTRGVGKTTETMAVRLEYWKATGKLLADRPLLGVGPGNFGSAYTRYMDERSSEKIKDPHNLFLEMWATTGVLGLVGLILALAAFLWAKRSLLLEPGGLLADSEPPGPVGEPPAEPDVRWEFYVGGAIGLVMAFALKALGQRSEVVITEGIIASIRTIIWFVAFGLMERVIWPPRLRALVLTVGVLALLANLLVSGGIGAPSVTGLLLASMALALNSPAPQPIALLERYGKVSTAVPFPALFALVLVYLVGVFYPTTTTWTQMNHAMMLGRAYEQDQNTTPIASDRQLRDPNARFNFLRQRVVAPLLTANDMDRWDPLIPDTIADWSYRMWELAPTKKEAQRLGLAVPTKEELGPKVIAWAQEAQRRDAAAPTGYVTEAYLREKFARFLEQLQAPGVLLGNAYTVFIQERGPLSTSTGTRRKDIREEYRLAAEALVRYQPNDPSDAPLTFRIAELYAHADDRANLEKWGKRALELDAVAKGRMRSLSDPQRDQLKRWLRVRDSS
jgi:O-antigen ligase